MRYHTSRKKEAVLQRNAILSMVELCQHSNTPLSIKNASKYLAGGEGSSDVHSPLYDLKVLKPWTIRRWYNHWLDYNELPCESSKNVFRKWKHVLGEAEDVELKRIVDANPTLYLDEISAELQRIVKKGFSMSSISRRLRGRLGYTRKVIYEKASQQQSVQREGFIANMRHLLENPEMAIFIDESNKDRKAAKRKYGWSKKGQPVHFRAPFNRDIRYTFIGAADCYGFVVPACDFILHKCKEKEEIAPMNAERFVQYVREVLVPNLGNFDLKEPRSVVIMDNCSIHMDIRVGILIADAGAVLLYSAPYSPDLIPIEYMFHSWKAFLKRHSTEFFNNW